MAAGQFVAGRHHAGMLAIADQQFIAGLPRQAPERQHAGRGHVFAEGHPMGSHPKPLAQVLTQLAGGAFDQGPNRPGEGTQLLDLAPGAGDGFEGRGG